MSFHSATTASIAASLGVSVTNLRYFGSQPHPFPHSLMVGFVADWSEGEIEIVPLIRWEVLDYVPFEVLDFPEDEP